MIWPPLILDNIKTGILKWTWHPTSSKPETIFCILLEFIIIYIITRKAPWKIMGQSENPWLFPKTPNTFTVGRGQGVGQPSTFGPQMAAVAVERRTFAVSSDWSHGDVGTTAVVVVGRCQPVVNSKLKYTYMYIYNMLYIILWWCPILACWFIPINGYYWLPTVHCVQIKVHGLFSTGTLELSWETMVSHSFPSNDPNDHANTPTQLPLLSMSHFFFTD